MGSFDDLIPGGSSQSGSGAFDDLIPKKSSLARRVLGDTGVSLLKGAVAVPEAAVGLGNIVSGGLAGKYAEQAGFRPKEAKAMLDEMYSPEQKAANQYVQEGDGFVDTFKRAIERPSVIGQSVAESLPLLLPGAAAARGISAATKVAPYIAGAAGEGLVGAGSAAEQLRQGSEDGTISGKQTLGALASGVGTAGFGALGGKLASSAIGKKLGISDIDTVLAGGASNPANVGLAKRALSGAVSEGVLEELPQSMWEQAAQNYATDNPIGEGVGQAGAMGLLAGTAMGGTFNAMQRGEQRKAIDGAKPAALGLKYQPNPAMHVFPDGSTMTGAEYQQYQASQEKARLDGMIQPIPATPEQVKALGYMPGTPLVVFPDGTAMTRAEFEQDRANKEQDRLDSMIQPADPEPKLQETGPMSAAVNVGVDSGATSLRPQGSFSEMSEFANLLGEEQQDVQSRRTGIAHRQALQREVALQDADQRVADQMAKEAAQRRRAVLNQVLSDPNTQNPAERFAAELKRQGFRDSTPTADELATVQRFNDIKAAQPAGPEIEPSLPNELDAEQLGIRSRKGSSGAQSSGRDKVAEVRQLVADGWKISNKTLASPTGKKRILNTAEHAAAKEATRERNLARISAYRQINQAKGNGNDKSKVGERGEGERVVSGSDNGSRSTDSVSDQADSGLGKARSGEIGSVDGSQKEEIAPSPQAAQANDAQVESQPSTAPQAEGIEQPAPAEATPPVAQSDVEDYGKRIVRRNKRAETNEAPVVEVKESRGPSPISKRDDLVGAIMRVTGGNGVAASMSQTITGDTANRASKVRGLFTNNGTMDLDDIANDLRTEEGYDVKDGNHLAELIREQAAGNPVYSMERNERDAAANEEKKQKDAVLKQANELGLKGVGGKRTLAVVEAEIAKEEARLNQLEKEAERKAIQAADAIDSAIGADMTEADFMRWLSDDIANTYTQEEIKRAEQDQADRADAKAQASAIADAEERAQSNSRQGNGNQPAAPQGGRVEAGARANQGFDLTKQTNQQAAEKFAQQNAPESDQVSKEQADRERDAVPFSMQQQSQPKPQGRQTGLFTADGRVSSEAKQTEQTKAEDEERFEREMRANSSPTKSADDDVQTSSLRYVSFAKALEIAKNAVASGVKPLPAQFHSRLDLTMSSADRLIAAVKEQSKETDKGVAMFSRTSDAFHGVRSFVRSVINGSGAFKFFDFAKVGTDEARKLRDSTGLFLSGYSHSIDENAVRHVMRKHGNMAKEVARGQIGINEDDLAMIPAIVANYDSVSRGANSPDGKPTIVYQKTLGNGVTYYVEEVRTGREKLMAKTMWKVGPAVPRTTSEDGVVHTSETSGSQPDSNVSANGNIRKSFGDSNASRGQGSGMAFRDLQAVVDRVSKGFNNLPKIHVLDSPRDLSDRRDNERTLKEQIEQAGAMDDVEGAHHNGEIYLFASGIASEERAEHVLATHEITHYGLRGTMGKGLDSALQNIWLYNKEVRAKAAVLRMQLGLTSNVSAVEEVLAEMKDSDLVKLKGWRKMVQAFRDWAHKAGFDRIAAKLDGLITKGMSDQEKADLFVANMVNAARDWVRNGKPARGYDPGTSMLGDANFSAKRSDVTDTPAFRKWFGNSKVVDANGKPLVVYHGTKNDFTTFLPDSHFGTKEQADTRLDDLRGKAGKSVMPVYLSIQKMKRVKDQEIAQRWADVVATAKRQGYDGLIYKNEYEGDGTQDSYIVFNPEQVKSATGNNGNFDASNPDIRFSRNKSASVDASITEIFDGLAGRGLKKVRAEERLAEHPQAESIRYVQDNILDILEELEGAGTIKINC